MANQISEQWTVFPVLYRDGENNRAHAAYIAKGAISAQQLVQLAETLTDPSPGWFIPAQLGLSHLSGDDPTLDGPWHTLLLDEIHTVSARPAVFAETDDVGSVSAFVARIRAAALVGWDAERYQSQIGVDGAETFPASPIAEFPGFGAEFAEHVATYLKWIAPYVDELSAAEKNTRRAFRAASGMVSPDSDPDTAVCDHLADLMHLCDAVDVDFGGALRMAQIHHGAEVYDEL